MRLKILRPIDRVRFGNLILRGLHLDGLRSRFMFPKDIDLYQAYKATDNALHAVRNGGVIINLLECREGIGHEVFEQWSREYSTLDELEHQIKNNFIMGGHKSYYLARAAETVDLYIVSTLNPKDVQEFYHMKPFKDADSALSAAFKQVGRDATVWAMPHGTEVLPNAT